MVNVFRHSEGPQTQAELQRGAQEARQCNGHLLIESQ